MKKQLKLFTLLYFFRFVCRSSAQHITDENAVLHIAGYVQSKTVKILAQQVDAHFFRLL